MTIDSRLATRRFWFPVVLVATLAVASGFDPGGPEKDGIPHFDKIAHFFVYGLMSTLWFRFLKGCLKSTPRFVWALCLTLLYGVADEWIQSHNPNRVTDLYDFVADGVGGLTGVFVYRNWNLYRRILETPIAYFVQKKLTDDY